MSKYRDLAKKALNNIKLINENALYPEDITERINSKLEEDLRNNKHSLADCGIFPEGDIITSEMKLIKERFKEVVKRCREAFNMETVDNSGVTSMPWPSWQEQRGRQSTQASGYKRHRRHKERDKPPGAQANT